MLIAKSLSSVRTMLLAAGLLALAQYSYAVDGVTLIDQRAALGGKVTPGDAPGFPVTISQPGSYRLSGNLTVLLGETTAITITADDVTLDLNGFSILGPNVCTPNPTRCTYSGGGGAGILAVNESGPSPANVRVSNGVVRGMAGHGLRLMGNGTVVEKVHSLMNGGPGIVVGQGSIIDSVAELNTSSYAMIGLMLRGNVAMNNGVGGIFVRPGGVAIGNTAMMNGFDGINVSSGTAIGNTANGNGHAGIEAQCPAVIANNTASQNLYANIEVLGVANCWSGVTNNGGQIN